MNNSCIYILYVDLVIIIYYHDTALITLDTCFVLFVSAHRLYVSHSPSMVVCYLCVALVVLWIWPVSNRIWYLLEHFMSLHINLLTSSTRRMLMHEWIPRTRDFCINSLLANRYKHKKVIAKWWGWIMNVEELLHHIQKATQLNTEHWSQNRGDS